MSTWLLRISLAVNALVFAAIVWGWMSRGDFLEDFLRPNYVHKTAFFERFPLESGDVVMLGDSITEGGRWSEIFPDVPIKNRGIGGDTSPGVLDRIQQVSAAKPAAVFLNIGTNDLTHGAPPDARPTIYRQIVERILKDSPDTELYLQSLLPRDIEYREDIETYNRLIRDIAAEFGLVYIDLYPSFIAADGSIDDAYSVDELHLNGAGYQQWQALLEPYMSNYRSASAGAAP